MLIETGAVDFNDDLLIIGETTGVVQVKLEGILRNDEPSNVAEKGDEITFKSEVLVRPGDKVYSVLHLSEVESIIG